MSDAIDLVRPLPDSIAVAVHPHKCGDVVSISMVDAATGARRMLVTDPATAHQLATDLLTATTDPDIAAEADRVRDSR
ncbi:MAG: hypothetical protein KDB71_21090 [Mycobacterium sp.]|nr:hypothetical protein [Mycobacterium sp.]